MSVPLEEALAQVELEEGKAYQCKVNGRLVLVRVVKSFPVSSTGMDEEDVTLYPWAELPAPKTSGKPFRARPGQMPPTDIPHIQREDEA
jgi:hypothetical protein